MNAAISRYTTTDNIEVSYHAEESWRERANGVDYGPDEGWRRAEPLHWPGVHNALYARYLDETNPGVVLIAQRETLVGVWPRYFAFPSGEDVTIEVDLRRLEVDR